MEETGESHPEAAARVSRSRPKTVIETGNGLRPVAIDSALRLHRDASSRYIISGYIISCTREYPSPPHRFPLT